jgi:hypothetical protein
MKKRNLGIAGISILILSVVIIYFFVKLFSEGGNEITVTTDEQLSADKVKIEFGLHANTINRKNDIDLFKNRSKYTVVYDGGSRKKMETDYGENDFLITYDNTYYFSFRQFIQTDFKGGYPDDHKYSFHFSSKNKQVYLKVDIAGESPMSFERPMNLISNAEFLRCNAPIDSSKTIYNMIELVE